MLSTTLNQSYTIKDESSILLRVATPSDATPMQELALSIFKKSEYTLTSADEFTLTEADELKVIEEYSNKPGYIYILAEQDEKLVGMLNFSNGKRRRNAHTGELSMGVHPDFHNMGVGTLLLECLIDWAEKNDLIKKISLGVFINNSHAIHLYKNLGFMEEGRKRREIKLDDGEFVDLVLMCKFV